MALKACSALFQISYIDFSGSKNDLWTIGEFYDGKYSNADIDLSRLAGMKVKFVLSVSALGSPVDDRALWIAPHIVHLPVDNAYSDRHCDLHICIPSAHNDQRCDLHLFVPSAYITSVATATHALPVPTATSTYTPIPTANPVHNLTPTPTAAAKNPAPPSSASANPQPDYFILPETPRSLAMRERTIKIIVRSAFPRVSYY